MTGTGSTTKSATSSRAARPRARRGRRTERRKPGSSGSKRRRRPGSPDAESAPSVSPWKPCSTETTRVRPVAARPILIAASTASVRAREQHAFEPRGDAAAAPRRGAPGRADDAERDLPRRVELERLDERGPHARVVAADVVHPEAAEPVEVARALGVVQVRALGARPARSKPIVLQHRTNCGLTCARAARARRPSGARAARGR